jgi:membrane-bound lytic murein transglycosylase B
MTSLPLWRRALPLAAFIAAVILAAGPPSQAAARKRPPTKAALAMAAPSYGQRDDVLAWAEDIAQQEGLPREWVAMQLAQARRVEAVRKLIMPPPAGTAKNWALYRDRFVEPLRVNAGLAFWRTNESWLAQAQQRWGVPAEMVVAIVGVETYYGRHTGGFRVIDALATLSFDFPPGRKDRSAFFRSELAAFLAWCAREAIDPQEQKGSFAGAIGLPQFMPSSINKFAVDMDADGHINLQNSAPDVVGSVARYLADAGWQRDMPTHYEVAVPVDAADRAVLLGPDILPSFSAEQFAQRGAELSPAGRTHLGLLALIELQNGERAPSYVAGTQNFYAVTRYNWSSYYALAVIELAQALVKQRGASP